MKETKSLFKDNRLFQHSINQFLNKHHSTFAQEISKTSAFFELAVYNDIVKFYEANDYQVTPKNLKGKNEFIYALSPNAKPSNCSFFSAEKKYVKKNGSIELHEFEIRHNIRIQSAYAMDVFISPDYAIINKDSITSKKLPYYYKNKIDYFYVMANNVLTFAETKNYQPSPELILNFIGLVNEIKPNVMDGTHMKNKPMHFAPALFVSGISNPHLTRIRVSLQTRYKVNIFMGMFAYPSQLYSKRNQVQIQKIGTK